MSAHGAGRQAEVTLLRLLRSSLTGTPCRVPEIAREDHLPETGRLATVHGIVPWLLHNLPSRSLEELPASLLGQWRAWEQQNRLRVLANWSVALRVMGLLQAAGIRVVPIKGVALSCQLYGTPWLRPAGDVDLLIERAGVLDAHDVMHRAGFGVDFPDWAPTSRQWDWMFRNSHHTRYRDVESGMLIELHWRLHDQPLLESRDEQWIDGETEQLDVFGHRTPVLSAPVQYLLVMSHAARTRWTRLGWLIDAWKAHDAARAALPAAAFQSLLSGCGATSLHQRYLSLMRQILPAEEVATPGSAGIHILRAAPDWGPLRTNLDSLLFRLRLKDSLRYRLAVLRSTLVSPGDFPLIRFNDRFFWMYVLLRVPLFLFRRYLHPLLRA